MSRGGRILKKRFHANAAQVRLNTDLEAVYAENIVDISFPDPENIQIFNITLTPQSGIWRGGKFVFQFTIPDTWPIDRPSVKSLTRIWHPNISEDGNVCLNILRDNYTPVQPINHIIQGIFFLFNEPNPQSPLNVDAALQYLQDLNAFKEKAEEYIRLYCETPTKEKK